VIPHIYHSNLHVARHNLIYLIFTDFKTKQNKAFEVQKFDGHQAWFWWFWSTEGKTSTCKGKTITFIFENLQNSPKSCQKQGNFA
jgi:hypothetical protein